MSTAASTLPRHLKHNVMVDKYRIEAQRGGVCAEVFTRMCSVVQSGHSATEWTTADKYSRAQ